MPTRGEERSRAAGSQKLEKYLARKKALKTQPKRRVEEREVVQYEKDPRIQCPGLMWEYTALLSLHKNDGSTLLHCINQCPDILTHRVEATERGSVRVWGSISFCHVVWKDGRESPIGSFFANANEGDTIFDGASHLDCATCLAVLEDALNKAESTPTSIQYPGSTVDKDAMPESKRWFHEATGCTFEILVQNVVKRKRLRRPFPLSHRYHYNSAWKSNIMHNLPSENGRKQKAAGSTTAAVPASDSSLWLDWLTPEVRFAVIVGTTLALLTALLAVAGWALKAAAAL
jgi:hypothetical protein